jgi:hypothetical protein
VTGDEHALSFREQVTDQISDGVCFSSARRSLDEDPARMLELARDPNLLGIGGLAEEDIRFIRGPSSEAVVTFEVRRGRFEAYDVQKRPGQVVPVPEVL